MDKVKALRIYLYVFGVSHIVTAITIPIFFSNLLLWKPRNLPTELMVGSLYLAMGIVMIAIVRDPVPHKAFVDYVVIGNILHALVMIAYAEHLLHIILDAAFIGATGVLPLIFYPWGLGNFLRYRIKSPG
jgi:hypothetical protein